MNASSSLSSSAALFGGAVEVRPRPAPVPRPRPLPRIEPNLLLWLRRDASKKNAGETAGPTHIKDTLALVRA